MTIRSVALLGAGTMGAGMGANLLKAGFRLTVYNRTAAKTERLVAMGAVRAETPAEAAKGAEFVLAMLADDAASREAWLGADGALAHVAKGAVLMECSTLSPAWIAELAGRAAECGAQLLDAPVTGSRVQADGGQLTFLVGGDEDAFARALPLLEAMGKKIVHLGPTGSGAKMKLINNFLCGVQVASLAEGIAWLERSGLNSTEALELLKNGAPGSPLISAISQRMMHRDYNVNFLLRLLSKDMLYAMNEAASAGVKLTTAANARELLEKAVAEGYGEQDMSAVVELLRGQTAG